MHRFVLILLLLVGMIGLFGCGEEGNSPTDSQPTTGGGPQGVSLGDHAALNPILIWARAGKPADNVTYNVYFGAAQKPPLVASEVSDTTFAVGPLLPGARYYWAVASVINSGKPAKSGTYSFSTRTGIEYPMSTGKRWEYRLQKTIDGAVIDVTDVTYSLVEVLGTDNNWSFGPVYEVEETSFNIDSGKVSFDTSYYYAADSGLFLAGYTSTGTGSLLTSDGRELLIQGQAYSSLSSGLLPFYSASTPRTAASPEDIIIEDPPIPEFKSPIEVGREWVYRASDPGIVKKVTGYEIIDVPGGKYGCFLVVWQYDFDGDGKFDDDVTMTDYVAEQGLVKRTSIAYNVDVVVGGRVIDHADITDNYELVKTK